MICFVCEFNSLLFEFNQKCQSRRFTQANVSRIFFFDVFARIRLSNWMQLKQWKAINTSSGFPILIIVAVHFLKKLLFSHSILLKKKTFVFHYIEINFISRTSWLTFAIATFAYSGYAYAHVNRMCVLFAIFLRDSHIHAWHKENVNQLQLNCCYWCVWTNEYAHQFRLCANHNGAYIGTTITATVHPFIIVLLFWPNCLQKFTFYSYMNHMHNVPIKFVCHMCLSSMNFYFFSCFVWNNYTGWLLHRYYVIHF